MSLADEVRTVRQRVAARLSELEPLVREYDELVKLADELGIEVPGRGRPRSPARPAQDVARRAAGANAASDESAATATAAKGRRPRQAGSPARAKPVRQRRQPASGDAETGAERDARVIDALRAHPGSTITDLASMLEVPPTSLYRPVRELTTSGAVVKRGRGLFVEE